MKKTIALVVAGIVAGAAFVTALPHHASGAGAYSWKKVRFAHSTDQSEIDMSAKQGMIVRAAVPCSIKTGENTSEMRTCLVFQDP